LPPISPRAPVSASPGQRSGRRAAKAVDPTYRDSVGYGPPATEVAAALRWVDQKVLTDINLSGDTMRLPFQVRLPILAPPSMVASSASCHPRHDRKYG